MALIFHCIALLVAFLLLDSARAQSCTSGWVGNRDSCYKFVARSLTVKGLAWEDAEIKCQSYGGHLVSIANQVEQTFITSKTKQFANERFWIGYNDRANESYFNWTDGLTGSNYTNWRKGEPNNFLKREDCVELVASTGLWNDEYCAYELSYICKRSLGAPWPTQGTVVPPVTSAPIYCGAGWDSYGTSCYKFSTVVKTWTEAMKDCRESGGYLVKVDDSDEQHYLSYRLRMLTQSMWIGLSDRAVEGTYVWVGDKSSVNYTNWFPGEPNDFSGNEDCVQMLNGYFAGFWNDNFCAKTRAYICEKPYGKNLCPANWVPFGDSCLQFNTHPAQVLTWSKASESCRITKGAELISIHSQDEQTLLLQMLKDLRAWNIWIGLNDIAKEGLFVWNDRSTVDYTNWSPNEPGNDAAAANKDCAVLVTSSDNGTWATTNCSYTRTYVCRRNRGYDQCNSPLGMENLQIADSQITASSSKDSKSIPSQARLKIQPSSSTSGAWCAKKNNKGEYLQIDLGLIRQITHIAVQGRPKSSDFVKTFYLRYGNDGQTFINYGNNATQSYQILTGSKSSDAIVNIMLSGTINCRFLRIYPLSWSNAICMRTEIYGCEGQATSSKCKSGWEEGPDNTCYQFNTNQLKIWADARATCTSQGGDLLSIVTNNERIYIDNRLKSIVNSVGSLWIGLNDRQSNRLFYWSDHSPYVVTRWDSGYPKDTTNGKSCVELVPSRAAWRDVACGQYKPFICKRKLSPPHAKKYPVTSYWISGTDAYWPLDSLVNGKALGTTPAQVFGNITKANLQQNAKSVLQFASYNSYLTAGDYPGQCIGDANACNTGLSVSLIVNLDAPTATWASRKFLVDSIGDKTWATSRGFAVYVEQMQIKVMVMTTTTSWSVSAPMSRGAWHHVVFTWIPSGAGLILYIDSKKKGSDSSGTTLIPTHATTNNKLTIGSKSTDITQGVFFMRSLAVWYRVLDPSEITDIFLSEFGKCRLGWKEYGQYCYQFNNDKKSWQSARSQCQTRGGDLVSITSPVEQAHITMEVSYFGLSTFAWIGFHDKTLESVWEWSDGSPARFTNWYNYQPDNWYWHGEDCAHTYQEFYRVGRWNDISCGTNMAYICKRKKEYSPSGGITPTVGPRRVFICEWASDILSCPTSTVISVQSATYGRTDPGVCGRISVTNCRLNVTQRLRGMCDGLAFCSVRPTNALMGKDPCTGIRKYLDVNYQCKKGPVKTPDCPDGWLRYPSGAACFGLMLEKKTWFEARDSCKATGSVLATVNFELVNALVTSLMIQSWDAGDIWIGFNDIGQRGVYRWLDDKPIRYTNWWNGEPNDRNSNGSCVRATMTSSITDKMYWVDSDCNLKLAYVCYKFRRNVTKPTPAPTTIPTTPCPAGWKAYKMGCYRLFMQTRTWTAARDACRAYKNTALISIHDTAESVFVQGLLNNTVSAWIGLNDRGPIAGHVWADRTPVDFTKWGPLQPDSHSGQQPCVVVTGTGYWSDVGCYSTRPYICKMKRPRSPLTTVRPTAAPTGPPVPPGTCDPGWRYWRQMCYYFSKQTFSNLRTWFDARSMCRQAGGDLASVHSYAENAYILSVFQKLSRYWYSALWIGLSDLSTEGSYEWSDGSPLAYTYYGWWEPNNYQGQEDCIHMWRWNGRWNDNLCNKRLPFVCKKHNNTYTPPPTVAPTPGPAVGRCNPGWVHYDKSCYKFIGYESQTWMNAKAMCEKGTNDSTYGDLVSINNQYEQAFISTMMRADYKYKKGFWIGLNDLHTENLFSWINNDQVTYTNWNARQPIINQRLDCVDLVPGNPGMGRWRVRPCTYRLSYICETAALPLVPTSVPPTSSPDCPSLFTKYGDACYSMFYSKLTWNEAREVCSKYENGDIISIHSSYEQAFLLRNMINFPGDVWTGLAREANSQEFAWSDRSIKEYTHWSRGQPGQPGSKQTCVQASNAANNDGRWMEVDCNKKNGFMCRIYKGEPHITPILQGTCLPGFKKYDKFCYLFRLYDKRSWPEARFLCNKAGGDLVSILNQQEKDFLLYQTKEVRWPILLWTGLNDRIVERGYQWSDGSPVSFLSWAWKQPNDNSGRENCVGFNTVHGMWYDVPCSWRLGYVCKAKLECSLPLGMANYNITNAQLSASSQLNPAHGPGMGRINGSSGWCANATTKGQYFEVDFGNQVEITKISIKGITLFQMSAFIRSFTVSYATYKNQWLPYKINGATRIFSANWNSITVVTLAVDPAIPARFLRVQPQAWAVSICAQFEFYGCAFECRKPMGIGSGLIYDKLINASSQLDAQHGALQARPTSGIGWCPNTTDKNPWLQVTWIAFAKRLTKLATWGVGAGRGNGYVTKYKLAFSDNGYVWTEYSEKGLVRIFRGNTDPITPLVHVLAEPIKTKYFRLLPLAGSTGGKCLRFELYGCASGCNDALGMAQGTIEDSWLTASSSLDTQHNPTMARLNGVSGWCAASNGKDQYLQIDLGRMYRIRQVATQGSQDGKGFVKTFYLRTFLKIWQYYVFKGSKTLVANADASSVVVTTFYSPRRARLVQILPQSWSTKICMRVEIYGCIPDDKPTVQPTSQPTGSPLLPTTPPKYLSFDVKVRLTTVPWKDNYSDRKSTDFNNLAEKIITEVTSLYNKGKNDMASLAFQNVKIVSFKKGSIIVDFNITFFFDIAQGVNVTQRIKDSVKNGSIGSLEVDPEYLTITKIGQSGGSTSAQKKGPGSGLSSGAKAAIGVVVVLVILSGLVFGVWWYRKKYKPADHSIMKHETFDNPIHFSSQAYDMEG